MTVDTTVTLGPIALTGPLVAASGTVGSVWEFERVADFNAYGAMTAKSVSGDPWPGRQPPRLAPAGLGMLNGIGIQNPGVEAWVAETAARVRDLPTEIFGSAVGHVPNEFARVTSLLSAAGLRAIEVNLSCPNLEDGSIFAHDPEAAAQVIRAAREATTLPLGAKLSPDVTDIVSVAEACREAGADWLTLTNTARGFGIDIETAKPRLSGGSGGYSGPALKPISLRCVRQVREAMPDAPILGCGGVTSGTDVIEYLMAGASAVGIGTVHFAEPRAARRILKEVTNWCDSHGVERLRDLTGTVQEW